MTCSVCRQPLDAQGNCAQHGAVEPFGEGTEDTVSRDTMIGRQIGDWVVRKRIGAGGMGIVYEAWQPTIERRVAIKILRSEPGDTQSASGLIAEARAANAIGHRGIIDIFGFGKLDDLGPYIVMEYLEGSPLDEIIHARAPMMPREAAKILDEILSALAAAHARGVIHRDLKPSNVFLVNDPAGGYYVKVLDFGLAKRSEVPHGTSPQTRASVVVGTPEYMAPEQAMGKAVGPHTDLYALGIIAFELLTGKLPFEADSAFGMAMHQVNTPAPAANSFEQSVPQGLSDLIAELLEKEPANRPDSAQTVRNRLKQLANELQGGATQVVAPNAPTLRRASLPATDKIAAAPPKKLNPVVLFGAIGGAVVALLAGVFLFTRGGDAELPAPVPAAPANELARDDAPRGETPEAPRKVVIAEPIAVPALDPEPSPTEPEPVPAVAEDDVAPVALDARPKPKPAAAKARAEKPIAPAPLPLPPPPPLPVAAVDKGEGRLKIILEGWADLKIDGVSKGRLRPEEMTLPAGRHVIELVNPYKAPFRTEVVVEKDKTRVLEASLQPLGQ